MKEMDETRETKVGYSPGKEARLVAAFTAALGTGVVSSVPSAGGQEESGGTPTETAAVTKEALLFDITGPENVCDQLDVLPSVAGPSNARIVFASQLPDFSVGRKDNFGNLVVLGPVPFNPGHNARSARTDQLWFVADPSGNCVWAGYPTEETAVVEIMKLQIVEEAERSLEEDTESVDQQPQTEMILPFPKEIDLGLNGSVLHNMGKTWGIAPRKDTGGEEANLKYVQDMFKKYGNSPNGGKGKKLEIFFYDNPADDPFIEQSRLLGDQRTYYRFGREVGKTIEVHIALAETFAYTSRMLGLVLDAVNHQILVDFLSGNHSFVVDTSARRPNIGPNEVNNIVNPSKLFLYRAEGK